MAQDQEQFNATINQEQIDRIAQLEKAYVELELKFKTDVPGKGMENG